MTPPMNKKEANQAEQRAQIAQMQQQQIAMNHQLHLQSITTLTELFKATDAGTDLRSALEVVLIDLLEPFKPVVQPQSTNIIQ